MVRGLNTRVVGAGLIGLALVAGAWVLNSLQSAPVSPEAAVSVATIPAPSRAAIAVADTDSDGVEDWREPLLTAEPVILNTVTASYTRSNTLTERVGIKLMENYFLTKSLGDGTIQNKKVAEEVLLGAAGDITDPLYTNLDVTVIPDSSPELVRSYANAVALTLEKNDVKNLPHTLRLFEQAYLEKSPEAQNQLLAIARMYQTNVADLLQLPVPAVLRTQHLDLINAMFSMYKNTEIMARAEQDPMLTLLRTKRYDSDGERLGLAVQGIQTVLGGFPGLITEADAAYAFIRFRTTAVQ